MSFLPNLSLPLFPTIAANSSIPFKFTLGFYFCLCCMYPCNPQILWYFFLVPHLHCPHDWLLLIFQLKRLFLSFHPSCVFFFLSVFFSDYFFPEYLKCCIENTPFWQCVFQTSPSFGLCRGLAFLSNGSSGVLWPQAIKWVISDVNFPVCMPNKRHCLSLWMHS